MKRTRAGAIPCAYGSISITTIRGEVRYRLRSPSPERRSLGTYETAEKAQTRAEAIATTLAAEGRGHAATLADYADTWLDAIEADPTRRRPHHRQVWRSRMTDDPLAQMPLRSISVDDVQAWMDRLGRQRAARGKRSGQLLSDQTRRNALYVLSSMLKDAARDRRCRSVDCSLVRVRRVSRTDETWSWLKDAQVTQLLEVCTDARQSAFVALALYGGLRRGEVIGLRLGDLELPDDDGTGWLRVRLGADGGPTKGGKTRRGPLLPPGVRLVRAWLLERGPGDASDPVFARVEGSKALRFGVQWDCGWADRFGRDGRRYPGLRSRAEIPDSTRYHDLRHTYATALVSGRYGPPWPLRAVQEALGHASQKTTERYAHLEPGALDDLAEQTARAMRGRGDR